MLVMLTAFKRGARSILAASLLGLLPLLTGCGPGLPDATEAAREGILLWGIGADPKTLDPQVATGVTENRIISAITEGLIAYHPDNDNLPSPGVAESWDHNDDYSVWTFHLRPDSLWSNGDPVTADDFVYSYKRMLEPKFAGQYAQALFLLVNGQEYKQGQVTDFADVGVRALDPHTLELRLTGPTPYFLSMLKHYSWFPVHPPTIEATGSYLDVSGRWTRPKTFVGNGPYLLKEWKDYQWILAEKDPNYWDAENVHLKTIYFFPIEDDNTENRMFMSGSLHLTSTVPVNDVPILIKTDPRLKIDPYLGTYFYRINIEKPPLDDPRVRRALALAIDRQMLVDRVTLAGQTPAITYVPPGFDGYVPPDNVVTYNPEEARRLLAEAGYPGGQGFPNFQVLFNTSEAHRKIAEAVVEMWKQNLGIQPALDNSEWKVYLDRQLHQNYEISRSAWIGDYMDPITFLEMWTTGNGNNNTGWSNAEYDRLIAEAFRAPSPEQHYEDLRLAEQILLDELPILPVYFYTAQYMIDPRLKGWNPKLLNNRPYKYLYFSTQEGMEGKEDE